MSTRTAILNIIKDCDLSPTEIQRLIYDTEMEANRQQIQANADSYAAMYYASGPDDGWSSDE